MYNSQIYLHHAQTFGRASFGGKLRGSQIACSIKDAFNEDGRVVRRGDFDPHILDARLLLFTFERRLLHLGNLDVGAPPVYQRGDSLRSISDWSILLGLVLLAL